MSQVNKYLLRTSENCHALYNRGRWYVMIGDIVDKKCQIFFCKTYSLYKQAILYNNVQF